MKIPGTMRSKGGLQRSIWRKFRESLSCERCGFNHPACMDFHHRDPQTKRFGLGDSGTRSLLERILEADKCDVLCSNCHRIEHWMDDRIKL